MQQTFDHYALMIGVVVAFIAALISVKWMESCMLRHGLARFGYYRVVIAVFATVFLLAAKLVWI